jgi:hypothetical protein
MEFLKRITKNPWIRIWVVTAVGLAAYWYAAELSSLIDRYNSVEFKPDFISIESYEQSPINLFFKDASGTYSEIGIDTVILKMPHHIHCSMPEDVIKCLQKEGGASLVSLEYKRDTPASFFGSPRGVVTQASTRDGIRDSCHFVFWYSWYPWTGNQEVKSCVHDVTTGMLDRQRSDIAEAKGYIFAEMMRQLLYLIGAMVAVAASLFAAAWVVQGFRDGIS